MLSAGTSWAPLLPRLEKDKLYQKTVRATKRFAVCSLLAIQDRYRYNTRRQTMILSAFGVTRDPVHTEPGSRPEVLPRSELSRQQVMLPGSGWAECTRIPWNGQEFLFFLRYGK